MLFVWTENPDAANSPDGADGLHLRECLLSCSDNGQIIGVLTREPASRDTGSSRSPELSKVESIDDGSDAAIFCIKENQQR